MKNRIFWDGFARQRTIRYHLALTLVTGLIAYPSFAFAQQGIRELRNPSEMQRVPPVRAVGIRLSPATPIDFSKTSQRTELPPVPPTSPASTELNQVKRPERIRLKSKVSAVASNKDSVRSPLIRAQSPIEISIAPSRDIQTASAPPLAPTQSAVAGLVATETKVVADDSPKLELPVAPPAIESAPRPEPSLPTRPRISTPELENATRVDMDSHSTHEIAVEFPIQSVMVDDERICRAMSHGKSVHIVGLSLGESLVEVKPTDDRPSRYLLVKVAAPWQRSRDLAYLDQLVHAIQPLNPNGALTVRDLSDGSIVVQGKVDSEEVAKRIMELTRKLILVPVVDKLEIR